MHVTKIIVSAPEFEMISIITDALMKNYNLYKCSNDLFIDNTHIHRILSDMVCICALVTFPLVFVYVVFRK